MQSNGFHEAGYDLTLAVVPAAAAQQAIACIDKRQYGAMLKGENTDEHDKLRAQHEAALKELQTQYAQAMGIGFKKPKNQLLPDAQANAKDEGDFMAGFRKGLGLKGGEAIGQETTVSGLRDAGFKAQKSACRSPFFIAFVLNFRYNEYT